MFSLRSIPRTLASIRSRMLGGVDANQVYLGQVGREKIFAPWPSLIRCAGSHGSGRQEATFDFVRQAIACGHDVIALSSIYSRDPFGMVAAAELARRSDHVHVGDISRCPDDLLRSAMNGSRLRCFVWDDFENEIIDNTAGRATLEVFLQEVTHYVRDLDGNSRRLVITLTGAMSRNHDEAATSRLIEASAGKNVTLVFSDPVSCADSFATLRQADCILLSSTHSRGDVHPYIANLLRHDIRDYRELHDLREGRAVIACRVFGRVPLLGVVDLPYSYTAPKSADAMLSRIVKIGPVGTGANDSTVDAAAPSASHFLTGEAIAL